MSLNPEVSNSPRWSSRDPWAPTSRPPGAFPPSPNPDATNGDLRTINEVVKARRAEYVRKKTIKIKVGTWNVAAMGGTYKDLGGWFADGLGVKGLKQDLSGLNINSDSADDSEGDSDIETVEEQEARHKKKAGTLPRNDVPAVASGEEIDLYVLGLQEVIDVASVTEAMKPFTDPNPAKKWKRALRQHLPMGYKKVVEQQLIGLLLLVFASSELASEISSVDSTSVGTGLLGYLGNKGAVSARILVGESTRILFVNSHLAAGADSAALARRIWDAQQILSRTKFRSVGEEWVGGIGQPEVIGDEDVAFWFGDLNYRLDDIPGEDVRRLLLLHTRNEYDVLNRSKRRIDSELGYMTENPQDIPTIIHDDGSQIELPAAESAAEPPLDPVNDPASLITTLKSLLTHDQLHAQQRAGKAFHEGWREGDLGFLPTYKYDVGSVAMFDSGEKKRSPSWCDRILYRTRADYERYLQRSKDDLKAKAKDDEMKKRGLDDAATQENVLFDYDPATDGDDYDDDVEQHDNDGDRSLMQTTDGNEDALSLEEYISHQRVLSSDHKPLSAVFNLTYDSVDPSLKAQVHQLVIRDFDKAENEARPNVTLVLDHHSFSTSMTDKSSDTPELKLVDFGDVRYRVLYGRRLTIANTGQIEVVFAFKERSVRSVDATDESRFPSWLKVDVHQEADKRKPDPPDLGNIERYRLLPGDTTNIDLLVEISDSALVKDLNQGKTELDDILILRISNGRDYFIPIRGRWLQTCFHRSVDELARVASGVRALTLSNKNLQAQRQPAQAVTHSAPQELFTLTDVIPRIAERVIADWDMLHGDDEPPWIADPTWPFTVSTSTATNSDIRSERLAEIREALDTASPLDEHLNLTTNSTEKLSLCCEILIEFLSSLVDGIITKDVWLVIESNFQASERAKTPLDWSRIQDMVVEAMSVTPIHSVSLTFMTFMLSQLINEICAELVQQETPVTGRARSSTTASTMSNISLSSIKSVETNQSRFAFLPSLSRRTTTSSTAATSTVPAETAISKEPAFRPRLAHAYAEFFAPLIVRSGEAKLKAKDQKIQLARKFTVLEAFLQ